MSFEDSPGYQELRRVVGERSGGIIAVVGAGLSTQCGLPTWKRLSQLLLDDVEAYVKTQEESGAKLDISLNIESLRRDNDLWKVMYRVKAVLQKTPFENAVRRHLFYNNQPLPPTIMVNLWRLGIKGIITPNLDSLAEDAFAQCFSKGVDVSTATTQKYLEFLGDERRFVFHPHGQLGETGSWILTPDDLIKLLADAAYKSWWDHVISSRNLVFLGVNESDVSLKSYILNNSSNRRHFVVAPASAMGRLFLLQEAGFQHVPYAVMHHASGEEDHSELSILIENLVNITPVEIVPPAAYEGTTRAVSDLPPPGDMQGYPIETIRQIMNAAVASILPEESDTSDQTLVVFDSLRKKYLSLFNLAASVEPDSEYDELHGYHIEDVIGEGAFGRVYRAVQPAEKRIFAIKVIHPQMVSSGMHLNAFRRGAYAMRLLTRNRVSGMVEFKEAFEVPFSIVMEYVDGQDLEKAIECGQLRSLLERLRVVRRVAEVIHAAHSLKEQVLHRDLKPGNVLLSGYSYEREDPNTYIKLVDFDLCWHKYATAETIVHQKGSRGYAAPEMFDRSLGSTRSASVDVYSLGMLLYYVLTNDHPLPGMTERGNFLSELAEEIRHRHKLSWRALGWHLARTVEVATRYKPKERCSVPDFISMVDTAIAMESNQHVSTYLPIIGMQIIESVVGMGATVDSSDYGRVMIYKRNEKYLKCELTSVGKGFSVVIMIRIPKDERLTGSNQTKRDKRVEKKVRQQVDPKYTLHWTADNSKREVFISNKFPSISLRGITAFCSALEFVWKEIEHD